MKACFLCLWTLVGTWAVVCGIELGKKSDLPFDELRPNVSRSARSGDDYPYYQQSSDRRPDDNESDDSSDYSASYGDGDGLSSRGSNDKGNARPPYKTPSGFHDFVPGSSYPPPPPVPSGKSYNSGKYGPWKGEQGGSDDDGGKGNSPDYYIPTSPKGPYFSPDQMLMIMSQLGDNSSPHTDVDTSKFGGLLGKFLADPIPYLIAVFLPLSLIVAAILPSLINMMMANAGPPVITTTATGNNGGRNLDATMAMVEPVLKAIGKFGARSLENPACVQRIFCQVARGGSNGTENAGTFRKVLYRASTFIDDQWLDSIGVKTLVKSLREGKCEQIPCRTSTAEPKTKGDSSGDRNKKNRR